MADRIKTIHGPGALELIEEACHLLRRASLATVVSYLIGVVPFGLAFLYFIADMSRGAFADARCASTSFMVAVAYVWMKTWNARFAALLKAQILNHPAPEWNWRRWLKVAAIQGAIQPSVFITLPLASLILLPYGWVYAFYQNVTYLGDGEDGLRAVARRSAALSGRWVKQNHILFLVLKMFALVVFMNVAVAITQIPVLVKMFTGVETAFTRGGYASVMNTTFFSAAVLGTWLCVSPLFRAAYVLRAFYASTRETGEDLRRELGLIRTVAAALVALLLLTGSLGAAETVPAPAQSVAPEKLNRAIDEVLERPEFTWRLRREKSPQSDTEKGWFALFIQNVINTMKSVFRKMGNWFKDLVEWMGDMWDKMWGGRKVKPDSGPRNSVNWMDVMRGVSLILLAVVASAAAILLWRVWRTRPKKLAVVARPVAIVPDLREEGVMADQLPTDEWLKLAAEMMEKGEYRLAMRAFYLSGLSHLGKQGLISIARYKSNYEYRIELERRARARADLLAAFAENVLVFDRAWYGLHEVTPESIRQFRSNLDRIREC